MQSESPSNKTLLILVTQDEQEMVDAWMEGDRWDSPWEGTETYLSKPICYFVSCLVNEVNVDIPLRAQRSALIDGNLVLGERVLGERGREKQVSAYYVMWAPLYNAIIHRCLCTGCLCVGTRELRARAAPSCQAYVWFTVTHFGILYDTWAGALCSRDHLPL